VGTNTIISRGTHGARVEAVIGDEIIGATTGHKTAGAVSLINLLTG